MPRRPSLQERDRELQRQHERREFIEGLISQLKQKMEKRGKVLDTFISRGSLLDMWTEELLKKFVELLMPSLKSKSIPKLRSGYLQTLSTLVYIEWDRWPDFAAIFLEQNRGDEKIPEYTLETLEDPSFLGPRWAEKFLNNQYIFCPIDIEEGENIIRSKEWRLPFRDGGGRIGQGGFGEIVYETIARGHFRSQSDHLLHGAPYTQDIMVARKCFYTRSHFQHEIKNLSLLRASLSNHERIVPFLATVTVGRDFNIIFPLAKMDLEAFLGGKYRPPSEFTTQDLITEASNLTGALSFLHGHLQPPGLKCCHMDLKPQNILVFDGVNCPVGKWKISDFGISIMSVSDRRQMTVTDFVDNNTYPVNDDPQRVPRTYQPPEVSTDRRFGRRSDVWSLGCILVRILALGLDGLNGLKWLDERRALSDDGCVGYEHDYFHRGSPPVLNPHIETWLTTLPFRHQNCLPIFLEACKDILLRILSIDKYRRPLAEEVQTRLLEIKEFAPSERGSVTPGVQSLDLSGLDHKKSTDITATVASVVAAIAYGNGHELRALLNGNVMVEESHEGDRPVIHAIRNNFTDAVRMLQDYEPLLDLETPDCEGRTPLRLAAEQGNTSLVETLLRAGVDINAPSRDGLMPLMVAVQHGHQDTIEVLLNHGANCMAYSENGYTCVHYAAMNRTAGADVLLSLISNMKNVDVPGIRDGRTPLFVLVNSFANNDLWWRKFYALYNRGANLSLPDKNDMTPLSTAVTQGHALLAEKLWELKAEYGHTPLPRNCFSDMEKVVRKIRASKEPGHTRKQSGWSFRRRSHSSHGS
ncbi:hypothetical protein EYZ11_007821 [Aspergillus tanneri]|uniref:Protein kinase domain-containing protein n=1 Tax=Aspergillus tanneri TaxID=1220188 RepID=A0A4V3UNW6_9EURO|nr:uncharacterized protein ATNIH1004_000109 [Aspergillus tanneri]KAA8651231.1 hypothetical protein ATNIH1004_000109 [Aspergillus tanneri]THC92714.1 hypothetical protein EYZ11_007821 [Aspergillus tanneri]